MHLNQSGKAIIVITESKQKNTKEMCNWCLYKVSAKIFSKEK